MLVVFACFLSTAAGRNDLLMIFIIHNNKNVHYPYMHNSHTLQVSHRDINILSLPVCIIIYHKYNLSYIESEQQTSLFQVRILINTT